MGRILTVFTGLMLCVSAQAGAQLKTPNFQGFLREQTSLTTGVRPIQVAIYDAPTAGNLIFETDITEVQVSSGFFNLPMAPVGVETWPCPCYAEIKIGTRFSQTTLSPRDQIGATFFALYASSAEVVLDRLAGRETENHILNGGLGVGTQVEWPASTSLHVAGALELAKPWGGVMAAAPAGRGRIFHDWESGNRLKVSENGGAFVDLVPPGGGAAMFTHNGNAFGALALLGTNDANDLSLKAGGSEKLRIAATGAVGVDTAAPAGLFTVGPGSLLVTPAGDVGLSTTAPVSRLTVADGNIQIASNGSYGVRFADGSLLTKAGAGSGSGVSNTGDAVLTADADADNQGSLGIDADSSRVLPAGGGTSVFIGKLVAQLGAVSFQNPTGGDSLFNAADGWTGMLGLKTSAGGGGPEGGEPLTVGPYPAIAFNSGWNTPPNYRIYGVQNLSSDLKLYTHGASPGLANVLRLGLTGGAAVSDLYFVNSRIWLGSAPLGNSLLTVINSNIQPLASMVYVSSDTAGAAASLVVDPSGRIGLGTASPNSTLHVASNYLQVPTVTGVDPAAGDCDADAEAGRIVVRTDGAAGSNLWFCLGAAGWSRR